MRTRQPYRHRTIWLLAAWLLLTAMFLMAGCGAGAARTAHSATLDITLLLVSFFPASQT